MNKINDWKFVKELTDNESKIGNINEQIIAKKLESPQNITFTIKSKEVLKFEENGDIFVKGKLVDNDKEVVDKLREFLKIFRR